MSDCQLNTVLPLKLSGCGDGLKNVTKPTPKKHHVPSARKFNARTPKHDCLKQKLEKCLNEMGETLGTPTKDTKTLRKANSIAEITPTKSVRRTASATVATAASGGVGGAETTLHATPRATGERLARQRAARLVYRRLLLLAWRRGRARLAHLRDSSRRHRDQIGQLELQVDVLQNLRKSECTRRDEALQECMQLKNKIDELTAEYESINIDKMTLSEEVTRLQVNIEMVNVELGNSKNELYQYKRQMKILEQQLGKEREKVERKSGEKAFLVEKITTQENNIKHQEETIGSLEASMQETQNTVKELAIQKNTLETNYQDLLRKMENIEQKNQKLESQLQSLKRDKRDLELLVDDLQGELSAIVDSYDHLKKENELTKSTIIEIHKDRRSWLSNAKQLAILSAVAFKGLCGLIFPAYIR